MIEAIPEASLVAETGSESDALRYLEQFHPDVVVLDLKLTSGSGLTVLEQLKAVYPAMIAIVLTNYGHSEYRNKCMALGADYFFDKTLNIDRFNKLLLELQQLEAKRLQAGSAGVNSNVLH